LKVTDGNIKESKLYRRSLGFHDFTALITVSGLISTWKSDSLRSLSTIIFFGSCFTYRGLSRSKMRHAQVAVRQAAFNP